MNNQHKYKAFISYSHQDKDIAKKIGEKLMSLGTDIFIADWDIQPGDSLIEKIFEVGLKDANAFLILLSKASVNSNWVKEELNYATLRRIEKSIKVIPILIENVEIPAPLKTLLWVNLQNISNFDEEIKKINHSIIGISEKPKIGPESAITRNIPKYDGNLSKLAVSIASKLLLLVDHNSSQTFSFENAELQKIMPELNANEINDIVDELDEFGLIKVIRYLGTAPYNFGEIIPTYMMQLEFKSQLDYDPFTDLKIVAATLASLKSADGKALESETKLSIGRLNRAVDYLNDYGIIESRRFMGSSPYNFGFAQSTRKTKDYLNNNP